jgi:2',3'-cyclic-nucleotide 2'-phosphodiesterase
MRVMFLGDVVGKSGREAVYRWMPLLKEKHAPDFTIVNGENAAHGFGITEEIFRALIDCGADCVTLGNHAFDQKEALIFIEREPQLIRPLNFPEGTPGRGAGLFKMRNGKQILVMNIMGRLFVEPQLDDPFAAVQRELEACPLGHGADAIFIDLHAETTSEKMSFAHFVDGRASAVIGTHTHMPTADQQILPGGTGFQSDAGMCGDYNSVIGMDKAEPINRFVRKLPIERFRPAEGEGTVCGILVDIEDSTGLCAAMNPIRVGGRLSPAGLP